jgi:hypothetical protein
LRFYQLCGDFLQVINLVPKALGTRLASNSLHGNY